MIEQVHISQIMAGDTVEIDGVAKTVSGNNIKRGFMGKTLFGDSFKMGTVPVKKITNVGLYLKSKQ